jgi:hypothetical protein
VSANLEKVECCLPTLDVLGAPKLLLQADRTMCSGMREPQWH